MDRLQDHAVPHQDHPFRLVADRGVMGHDDEREALLLVQPLHQADDLPRGLRVQVAGRFVREHDVGLVREGPGDCDSLLLPAAEFSWLLHRHVFEADGHERGYRLLPRRLRVDAADEQRELDVLDGPEDRQQVVVLEDETHLHRAEVRLRVVVEGREPLARNPHLAGREIIDAGQAIQESRLPAAGGPHDRDHLAPSDVHVQAAEGVDLDAAAVVGLHELARDDDPVLDARGLRRGGRGTGYGHRFRSHDIPPRRVPVRGGPRKYRFWERPSRLHRRKEAASRVTARRPRAASPITNPRRTTAWAPAANPPTTRAATTTACDANPPRNPPRETRKKMPRAANEKADGFSFTRVRTAGATNEAAIGAATGRARLSIARRDGRARSRMTRNTADMPRPITAKLSMSPRK